jgi:hypothetical protein
MKPFDLEKALAGEPVVTREGKKVSEFYQFKTIDSQFDLFGIINGVLHGFDKYGRYMAIEQSEYDLFMEEPERWANIYWDDISLKAYIGDIIYSTEEEAKENGKGANYRTTIKLK